MMWTIPVLAVVQSSFVEVEGWQKQEKGVVQGRRLPLRGENRGKIDITKANLPKHLFDDARPAALTCVNPGDGAGFGTEVGPVIGCGGLFISRSFTVLH